MSDVHNSEQRSRNMAAIRGKNTKPELKVAAILDEYGASYELHSSELPGKPDFTLRDRRTVIFVHGCFWHNHSCRYGTVSPKTNADFWHTKIAKNVTRDRRNIRALRALGWRVVTIWECRLKNIEQVRKRISVALEGP